MWKSTLQHNGAKCRTKKSRELNQRRSVWRCLAMFVALDSACQPLHLQFFPDSVQLIFNILTSSEFAITASRQYWWHTSDGTGLVAMFDAELPLIVKDCFIYWSGVAIFHRVSFLELHFCALPQLTRNTSRQELIDLKQKKNDVEIGRMRHETQENEFENQHDELRQNHKNHRNCLRLATHCFTTKPSLHQLAEWQRASVMVFDFWRLRKKL